MSKIKLLIVNGSLAQAGTERWIYEVCKHLDKNKFEVGVLCYQRYARTSKETTFDNYYYHELKKLDIKLHEDFPSHIDIPPLWDRGIGKIRRTLHKITRRRQPLLNHRITKLFRAYDTVCIVDFNYYRVLKNEIHHIPELKFFIALLCHKFQFQFDPYVVFDQNREYNLVYFCPKQLDDLAESNLDLKKNNLFHFPLVMNLTDYPYVFNRVDGDSITIAHFARISFMRPIDDFIKAFARLRERSSDNWIFNIYGEIQDREYYEQLQNLINELNIAKDSIRFMGHSKNITETIKNDKINIYWGPCTNAVIGYSSIEITALGVPSFFWSYGDPDTDVQSVAAQTGNAIVPYNRTDDFVNATLETAASSEALADLSVRQRDYLLRTHNVTEKIRSLEKYIVSLLDSPAEK